MKKWTKMNEVIILQIFFDEKKITQKIQLYILLGSVGFEYIDNI